VDVQKKLDDIVTVVTGARAMPMSASCVINRADLLALLEELREALPGSLAQAEELLGGSEQVVEQARQEAERIIESAHAERSGLVSDTEIVQRSRSEADRILAEARKEADEIKAEADDYVDSKLANFEVVLTKTLGSVGRGREKLLGTGEGLDENGYEDPDYAEAPERSSDPDTLRERADSYVDVKLGAFEAVLAKTLEAVGRGRQKLHGRIATDELGALADSSDAGLQHASDADYLAGLAGTAAPQSAPQDTPRVPEQPTAPAEPVPAAMEYTSGSLEYTSGSLEYTSGSVEYTSDSYADASLADPAAVQQPYAAQDPAVAYAYSGQDAYGYGQDGGYADQMAAAYQQQEALAYQGYGGQDAYGYGHDAYAYDPAATAAAGNYGEYQGAAQTALDETSFFDTSMISAEQLRQYEQQRYEGR
jgi:vacuolar-type H+-ATPase subunit H